MLSRIHIGWHWLERTLNGIIAEVNAQKPLPSATIAVEESPNGTLLKVVGAQNQSQPGAPGAPGPAAPTPPTPKPPPVVWHNVTWQQVTVIDPSSCVQSTITVLVQSAGNNITIQ
jgi:hypothetical protein